MPTPQSLFMAVMQAGALMAGSQSAPVPWMQTLAEAEALAGQRAYLRAEVLYRDLLGRPPADLGALMIDAIRLALAAVLAEQGRLAEAAELLRTAPTADAGNARRFRHIALGYTNRLREARRALGKGLRELRRDPVSAWGWRSVLEGLVLQQQGAQALMVIEQALGRPLDAQECLLVARAAGEAGDPGAATALFHAARVRHPSDIALRDAHLAHLADLAAPTAAVAAWRSALRRWPDDAGLRLGLVRQLIRDAQWLAAIAQLEIVLADDRRQFQALLELGDLYAGSGQVIAAQAVYLEHIGYWPNAGPSEPGRHVQRADAYSRLVRLLAAQNRLDTLAALADQHGWTALQRIHLDRARHRLANAQAKVGPVPAR